MSDYFPQDVLANILLRLRTKTIGICLCVCKSWHFVITSPVFVHNHFTQTQKDASRRRLFLLRHFPESHNRERYSLHYDNYAFDKVQDLDFPLQSFNRHFRIVGSCNGVFCLSDDTTVVTANFVLWNPSIRKYISLPRPLVSCSSHGLFTYALGFGFDPLTCDYKVVMLAYLKTKYGFYSSSRPTVNVYSLNTNSWRDVSATALSYRVVEFLWTQVFMNGAVHWIASTHDTGLQLERFNKSPFGNLILRFGLSHEVFDKLSLPESLVSSTQYELSITVLGDRLSVVHFSRHSYDACSIWMMKEYGVAESWTKHLEIGLRFEIPYRRRLVTSQNLGKVLGLRGNGQLVLEMNDGRVLMYHPVTQMVKTLGIHGLENSFYFDNFEESLVLLGKGTGTLKGDCIQSKKRKRILNSCSMGRH